MNAARLLDRVNRLLAARPTDAAQVRAYIEGSPLPDNASAKTRERAPRLRAFVEAARHEAEGNARLRAWHADGSEP